MDIEDVFGDYQNGNYNVGNNSTAANDFLTSTETKMGGGSNPNGSGQKPPKPPKQKKKGGGGIIVFLLLVLILVGAFAFLYFKTDILSSLFNKSTPKESFMNTISVGVKEYSSIGKTAIGKINTEGDMTVEGSYQTKGTNTNTKYEYSASKKDGYLGINVKDLIDVVVTDDTLYLGDSTLETDKKYIGIRNEGLDKVYENFFENGSSSGTGLVNVNAEVKVPDSVTLTADNIIPSEKLKNNVLKIVSDDFNSAFEEDRFLKEQTTVDIDGEDKEVTRYYIKTTADECAELAKKIYNDIINDSEVKSYLTGLGVYDSVKKSVDSLEENEKTRNVNEITYSVYESKGAFVGLRVDTDKEDKFEIIKTYADDSTITYVVESIENSEEFEPQKSTSKITVTGSEVGYSITTDTTGAYDMKDSTRTAISNISPEGYEYSLESSSGASSIIVSGKVRYEFKEDLAIEVNPEEAYILNDVETDEDKENVNNFITGFVMKIMFGSLSNGGFTGGGTTDMFPITDEPTNTVTNTVTDPISNTIPDVTNTVIDEQPIVETPSVDVKSYSLYNSVLEEVKNVLTACITESQNNQMDITNYLNVGNLTANCPSLLTATLEKIDDSKFEGILTDMEGKQYKLVVDVNGFSSLTFDIVNP